MTRLPWILALAGTLLVAMIVLLGLGRERGGQVEAHTPHSGLIFSMGVDLNGDTTDDCTTRAGGPNTCWGGRSNPYTVKIYLDNHPFVVSGYEDFDIYLVYAGLFLTSKDNASIVWPDCGIPASFYEPPTALFGCAIGPQSPTSDYTGIIATIDFNCAEFGTITMVHGENDTNLGSNTSSHAEGSGTKEALNLGRCKTGPAPPKSNIDTYDTDGDRVPDVNENGILPARGGQRDYLNPWDYFNPTEDCLNRTDDITAVVQKYGHDEGLSQDYHVRYDRTELVGGNLWQFWYPDGRIRTFDIIAGVRSYGHDCG